MKKHIASACAAVLLSPAVLAHEGHGMSGAHWHATDAWGFAVLGGLIGIAVWLSRGGK